MTKRWATLWLLTRLNRGESQVLWAVRVSDLVGYRMQVFISYADPDESIAKRVADGLEKENFKVWYDAELLPGQDWASAVSKALRESKAMVVLLTPAALRSTRVQREIQYAL